MDEKTYLKNYTIEDYARPSIATDILAFAIMRIAEEENFRKNKGRDLKVLLIRRGTHPYIDKWALPGGFLIPGETVEETARRELREETNISNAKFVLLDIDSAGDRDPRGWIISNSYLALVNGDECELRADTDAWEAAWFTVRTALENTVRNEENGAVIQSNRYRLELYRDSLTEQNNISTDEPLTLSAVINEKIIYENHHSKKEYHVEGDTELAFDHAQIILKGILKLRGLVESNICMAFDFLPELFTLTELQNVFEQILDRKLLTANFRRSVNEYVTETEDYFEGEGHRPAKLYKRNQEKFVI